MYKSDQHSVAAADGSGIDVGTNVRFLLSVKYSALPRVVRGIVLEVVDDIVVIQGRHGGRYSRYITDVKQV